MSPRKKGVAKPKPERRTGVFVREAQGNEQIIFCADCGYEEKIRLPIVVNQFCDIIEGFGKRHAKCPEERKRKEGTDGGTKAEAASV